MLIIAGLVIFHILLWSANLLEKMRLRDSVSITMRIELDNHHHWVAQGVSLLVNY